jgi:hypothetical protein
VSHPNVPPAAGLSRMLSLVMIVLMLCAIAYATWIAIRYWGDIRV